MPYLSIIVIILLAAVVIKLVLNKAKQRNIHSMIEQSTYAEHELDEHMDDGIIAVRKCSSDSAPVEHKINTRTPSPKSSSSNGIDMLYVMSKENKLFTGYELLQALLSSGLRFGEMNIFHHYREADTQEGILFSLASATEPGVFDMLNMGTFSCRGLTLFMRKSDDAYDNKARYDLMLKSAQHLSEDLDGILLDASKQPLLPGSSIEKSEQSAA